MTRVGLVILVLLSLQGCALLISGCVQAQRTSFPCDF